MIKRISEFIQNQKLSVRAFEQSISASDGMIRRAINNNTDIQSKWIGMIADKYPRLNIIWLVTGQGDMLHATTPIEPPYITQQSHNDDIVTLLKEQLKDKEAELKELNQEIGLLKSDNRKLMEQVMGLDISGYKSSVSPSQSQSKDAPSVSVHL